MKKGIKAINIIVNTIAVLAILVALLAMWSVITTERGKAPELFGTAILRVVSGSMEPKIPSGTVVFTKPVDFDSLQVGDIIAFYSDDPQIKDMINTHRIANITEENGVKELFTKGDANTQIDNYPVLEDRVVGKVIGQSSLLGALAVALSNKVVFILIIMLPLLLIILSNLRQIIHLIKKGMEEDNEDEEIDK